ncbi:hypothetical protein ACCO45_003011 [Purpureocillium lilacinum]|uniref:Uncharacterized protein n=1 Tax=Purpureocillium lilacinum TaxID=33203 RepID=A0ACC4DZT9_PURLI
MDYVEHRMAQEAAKQPASAALLTPLNLILLSLLLYTLYSTFFSSSSSSSSSYPTLPRGPRPPSSGHTRPAACCPTTAPPPRTHPSTSPSAAASSTSRAGATSTAPGALRQLRGARRQQGPRLRELRRGYADGGPGRAAGHAGGFGTRRDGGAEGWEERFLEKYDVVGRLVSVGSITRGSSSSR